jgi:hypothetical protein
MLENKNIPRHSTQFSQEMLEDILHQEKGKRRKIHNYTKIKINKQSNKKIILKI